MSFFWSPVVLRPSVYKFPPSRVTSSISVKFDTKHSWVKRIQVCSYEGARPFPSGDIYEIPKIHRRNLKIFFNRTTGPISTKLDTKHTWVKRIKVCSNEGSCPFLRGDNNVIAKIHWQNVFKKSHSSEPLDQFQLNFKWRILKVLQIRTIPISKRR